MSAVVTVTDKALIDRAVAYHGELCPGLATGIQIARLALQEVGENGPGHRVVAVAETDICAVDAVQALVGCTVGNRNLISLDHGKLAFQFFADGKAIRISGRPSWNAGYQELRSRVSRAGAGAEDRARFQELHRREVERILATPPEQLFTVTPVDGGPPITSSVDPWLVCSGCGEDVMESRVRRLDGRQVCIACFHRATGRF